MKKKILVMFFLALVITFAIYKFTFKDRKIYLALGDALAKGNTPFDSYNLSYVDYLEAYLNKDTKKYIVNKDFIDEDLRIKDLTEEIKNSNIRKSSLPETIKNASIITISIGSEELFSKLRSNYDIKDKNNYKYIDSMYSDLSTLLKEIRKITDKPIYVIGYYNPLPITSENEAKIKDFFNLLNNKLKMLEKNKNIYHIEIFNGLFNEKMLLPNLNNAFPTLEGYKYIANQIIKKIES